MSAGNADDGSDDRTASREDETSAVVLLAVAGGAAVAGAFEGGAAAIAEGVVLAYLAVVLAYGAFTGRLDGPVTQTGFGVD